MSEFEAKRHTKLPREWFVKLACILHAVFFFGVQQGFGLSEPLRLKFSSMLCSSRRPVQQSSSIVLVRVGGQEAGQSWIVAAEASHEEPFQRVRQAGGVLPGNRSIRRTVVVPSPLTLPRGF